MIRQIFLDTETTGLDPKQGHRLIEIAGVELINRRFTGNNFHVYINPEREVDQDALAVHGLNNAFLADKPKFEAVYSDFLAYIQSAELIIHNAGFDVSFLEHELALVEANVKKLNKICSVTDTLSMARKMHPGQKNSLDALCKRYKIDNTHRTLHGALLDAQILGRVYLAMTGGQSSLLEGDLPKETTSTVQDTPKNAAVLEQNAYPVIMAEALECEAHEAFLALLNKKSNGACEWAGEPKLLSS